MNSLKHKRRLAIRYLVNKFWNIQLINEEASVTLQKTTKQKMEKFRQTEKRQNKVKTT